jgi:osmotically-inducible protein OsmY
MAQATTTRPDIDLEHDLEEIIIHYPPLMQDRHHIQVSVKSGVVTVQGYTRSPNSRRYLLEKIPLVEDVTEVHADQFFDDESIRFEVGRLIPAGQIFVRMEHGVVILSGRVPDGVNLGEIIQKVQQIPGVRKVFSLVRKTPA